MKHSDVLRIALGALTLYTGLTLASITALWLAIEANAAVSTFLGWDRVAVAFLQIIALGVTGGLVTEYVASGKWRRP